MSAVAVGSAVAGGIATSLVSSAMNRGNTKTADNATTAIADSTALQSQIGRESWDRYKSMYTPMEQSYINDAQNYDSPENYQRAAGDAQATVSSQFGKARDRLNRTPGLDPSTPAYTAAMAGLDTMQAATDATAQNTARQNVRDTAFARKGQALNVGRGLPAVSVASLNGSNMANFGLSNMASAQGMVNAGAAGNVVNRAINPTTVKAGLDWLGSKGSPSFYDNTDTPVQQNGAGNYDYFG